MRGLEITFRGLPPMASLRALIERVSAKIRRLFHAPARFSWTVRAVGVRYDARCRMSAGPKAYSAGAKATRSADAVREAARRIIKQIRRHRRLKTTVRQRGGIRRKDPLV